MSSSGVSSKRVTFSDEGSVQRPHQLPMKHTEINAKRKVKSSDVPKSQPVRRALSTVLSSGSSSNSAPTNRTKSSTAIRKTLVRNTAIEKPTQRATISRETSVQSAKQPTSSFQTRLNMLPELQDIRQQNLSVPCMQSNLDTARRIQALSELDLDSAQALNKNFDIDENDLLRKVSNMAVNVPSSDCLYNDLVSVEFAENRLKSRSTTARPAKTREKSDSVPLLSDFVTTKKEQEGLWPRFPSIMMSFKPIDLYNPKSVTSARRNILEQTENLFRN